MTAERDTVRLLTALQNHVSGLPELLTTMGITSPVGLQEFVATSRSLITDVAIDEDAVRTQEAKNMRSLNLEMDFIKRIFVQQTKETDFNLAALSAQLALVNTDLRRAEGEVAALRANRDAMAAGASQQAQSSDATHTQNTMIADLKATIAALRKQKDDMERNIASAAGQEQFNEMKADYTRVLGELTILKDSGSEPDARIVELTNQLSDIAAKNSDMAVKLQDTDTLRNQCASNYTEIATLVDPKLDATAPHAQARILEYIKSTQIIESSSRDVYKTIDAFATGPKKAIEDAHWLAQRVNDLLDQKNQSKYNTKCGPDRRRNYRLIASPDGGLSIVDHNELQQRITRSKSKRQASHNSTRAEPIDQEETEVEFMDADDTSV